MGATLEKELAANETEEIYRRFCDYVHGLSFGYITNDEQLRAAGTDLVMLKEFYTPQDCLYVMDMPADDFFTVDWFAEKECMDVASAEDVLRDLAKRGNIYREMRDDGQMWYHNAPAAHGIYEFHAGDAMNAHWLGEGLFPVLQTGTLQIVYDAGIPFYRCLPAGKEVVREGELLPSDDIFEMLRTHRRFCVSSCACIESTRDHLGVNECEHPMGVCIQTDEMADYYLDDLNLGKEATLEQVEKILEHSVDSGLAIQATFAEKNEIICSCSVCHCGILPALKNWPGDAAGASTNYVIEFDRAKCTKSGACVERCTMQSLAVDEDGYPILETPCIGCGQCVLACQEGARILVRKPDDQVTQLPETIWKAYAIMEENRRAKGAL